MVGFISPVKLEWLNKTAELVLDNKSEIQIKNEINEYLALEIKSPTALRKTREILMNTWVRTHEEINTMKRYALEAFKDDKSDKLALHWGMLLNTYPVFNDACALIGKLTNIQDTFTSAWLRQKLFELWGERETLLTSCKKILQTMKQMGVIEQERVGTYRAKRYVINDVKTIQVLLMAVLHLREKPIMK